MSTMRPKFWEEIPLEKLNATEWEALCDGCGKCCLNKIEDEDSGEVFLTNVACRLLDGSSCQCSRYETRHKYVPECIVLNPVTIQKHLYWLPQTCAYRLRLEDRPLYPWHYLISGDRNSVHEAGVSMKDQVVSEYDVADDDWEDHIIEEPV